FIAMMRTPRRHEGTKNKRWLRVLVSSWLIGLIAAAAVATVVTQQPSDPAAAPQITIVSPVNDSFVSGPTVLSARVEPPAAAAGVTFFADGRQVCALNAQPFECEWDAGSTIAEHQIRAVAALAAGGRIVNTVRTKGVGYAEHVNVDVVQVTVTVPDGHGK